MVYWITGKAGAGKTHYANALVKELLSDGIPAVKLDGDVIRGIFPTGYSDESRQSHIMRVARLAAEFESQGLTVVCSLISPKKIWRDQARVLFNKSLLVYLPGGKLWEGTNYEVPTYEEIIGW